MIILIIPGTLQFLIIILGVLSFLGLLATIYLIIVRPILFAKALRNSPPPEIGYNYEVVIDGLERTKSVSICQMDGDINTRMNGIKEDHLVIKFTRERGLEEYLVALTVRGPVFFRPPHSKTIELIRSSESFDSRQLIGYPVLLRLAASMKDNRPLQYIDFELSTKYFLNQYGEEKMKFSIILTRIFPGLDRKSRNKKGIYMFGRLKIEPDPDEKVE